MSEKGEQRPPKRGPTEWTEQSLPEPTKWEEHSPLDAEGEKNEPEQPEPSE